MDNSLGIDDQRLLDAIANDFEQDWTVGNVARISAFLDQVKVELRPKLLESLLETEVELAANQGILPQPEKYSDLSPQADGLVRQFVAVSRFSTETVDPMHGKSTREASPGLESRRIGPYKLLHQIGEGGMGSVWMAEQEKPVRRRVAIKLIKDEVGNRETIARFEAERQALAIMDHQNIAKVLDAGTADSGRPYFVMELVKGVPITDYCDQNKLGINERLELMVAICNAVQHAHQKGIIHRDLKPSNVLVSLYDGKPTPKIIDFGLAKALEHTTKLTDKTVFTEFGKVVGTLQYMSPEQAEMNALDVDTRTDVYSLGVLLYELLTGSTPIDKTTMKQNLLQLLVYIKESEPPRPSIRLSTSGDAITGISDQRKISPSRLKSVLKGELDWIVMKALEKDRTRRYETASQFGEDMARFLAGETVSALPPSRIYQLRKLIKRNKGWVTASLTIVALLITGFVGMSILWYQAQQAKNDALVQQRIAESQRETAIEASENAQKNEQEAIFARQIAEQRQLTTDALLSFFQDDLLKLANPWELELATREKRRDITLKEVVASATEKFSPENFPTSSMQPAAFCAILRGLADIHEGLGNYQVAEKMIKGAFEISQKEFSPHHPVAIEAGINLSFIYLLRQKRPEAINQTFDVFFTLRKVLIAATEEEATPEQQRIARQALIAWVNTTKRRIDFRFRTLPVFNANPAELLKVNPLTVLQVRSSLDDFVERLERLFDPEHDTIIFALVTRGCFDFAFNKYVSAQKTFEKLLEISHRKIEDGSMRFDSVGLMGIRQVLALTYAKLKIKKDSQMELAKTNFEIMKSRFSPFHPATLIAAEFYGSLLVEQKKYQEALPILKARSAVLDEKFGLANGESLYGLRAYARCLWESNEQEKAFILLKDRFEWVVSNFDEFDRETVNTASISVYQLGQAVLEDGKTSMALRCFELIYEMEKEKYPDNWSTFDTQSCLGEAQFRNGDREAAKTNLLKGYAGLRERHKKIPSSESNVFASSIKRLIRFYEAQSDAEAAAKWKAILESI